MNFIRAAFLLVCGLLLPNLAFGQGASYSNLAQQNSAGNIPRVVPNAPVVVCGYPATGGPPCTNLAATFTSPTNAVACASNTQVVLPTTSTCSATADAAGNFVVFLASGTYSYYWENGSTWNGPYVFVAGGGSGNSGISGTANTLGKILGGGVTIGSSDISDNTGAITILNNASVDLTAASFTKLTTSAGASPTIEGRIAYDSTAHQFKFGANGVTTPLFSGNIAPVPNVAGALAIGSAGLPWSSIFLGASANNTANLTGTFTANRTITIPDATTTLAGLNNSNAWLAGAQDFSGAGSTIPWITGSGAPANGLCTKNGMAYFDTAGTPGQQVYFCNSGAWTLQLNSGVGGASVALSNLSAVAYNIALTPAAGNVGTANANMGAAATPVNSIYIGAAATNNVQLKAPTITAARNATLPDNTGTIAETNFAQTWSATQSFSAIQSSAANPASTGFLRFANGDVCNFRNAANNADLNCLSFDSSNFAVVGAAAGIKVTGITGQVAGSSLTIQPLAATGNGNGGDHFVLGGNGAGSGSNGWVHLLPGTGGSGGAGYIDTGTSALVESYTNDSTNPTAQYLLTSYTPTGTVSETPTNAAVGVLGICVSSNCATTGATVSVAYQGIVPCSFDNTATPGDVVVPSSVVIGECHDAGTVAPPSLEVVGSVGSLFATGIYNVSLAIGGGGGASLPTNVVVTNPSVTQTIQATSAVVPGLIVESASGAAAGQIAFQVQNNAGSNLFSVTQGGTITFGSGSGGSLTLASVTASKFNSGTGTIGTSGVMNLAKNDCLNWENNAGNNNALLLCKNTADNLQIGTFNPGTSAGLAFATTNQVTLSVSNPSAPRTITFADPGANDSVTYLNAAQTFQSKTFNDQVTINGIASLAGNPAGTACSIWYNSGTSKLQATNNAGADCTWSTGGGSGALSALTSAIAANTLSSGDFAQLWKWTLSTASKAAFEIAENAASTNGAGAQFLTKIDTLAASTAIPLQVTARGTANGFLVDSALGNLKLLGTANIDLNTGSAIVKEFPNEGTTGTGSAGLLAKINSSGQAIKAATTDTGALYICVAGCGTTGNAQLATSGFVSATFDNATTNGDCVIPSTGTAGDVHDVACSALAGAQLLGRVLSTNGAAGTYAMDLYPMQPALAVGGTNGMTLSTSTNGAYIFDLPQALKTSSVVQFNEVDISQSGTTAIRSAVTGGNLIVACGQSTTGGGGNCVLTLQGANQTGAGNNTHAGNALLVGGNNASTGTGAAGTVDIQGGHATAAANKNGYLRISPTYIYGTHANATGDVMCFTADNTAGDCATSSTNQIGVATGSNGNSVEVTELGSQVTVNLDGTYNVSAGWYVCTSATTAGLGIAQSGTCPAGRLIGVVEKASNTTTAVITVRTN